MTTPTTTTTTTITKITTTTTTTPTTKRIQTTTTDGWKDKYKNNTNSNKCVVCSKPSHWF
eukprot:381744-Amphidinium_carterae.1